MHDYVNGHRIKLVYDWLEPKRSFLPWGQTDFSQTWSLLLMGSTLSKISLLSGEPAIQSTIAVPKKVLRVPFWSSTDSITISSIARNRRQNPYILIWLGPGRRTGRRRARLLAQKPLPYKVNGVFEAIVFCLRKSVLLDVDVFCIRWLLLCFASIFWKKKRKKRVKYRLLWQLNFFPGHHEPVDCHWPPVKSSSFTKTARQKALFSWGRVGGIQFHSIGFAERHV